MIIFEILVWLFVVAMVLFGKIEYENDTKGFKFKLGLMVVNKYLPLISIIRTSKV